MYRDNNTWMNIGRNLWATSWLHRQHNPRACIAWFLTAGHSSGIAGITSSSIYDLTVSVITVMSSQVINSTNIVKHFSFVASSFLAYKIQTTLQSRDTGHPGCHSCCILTRIMFPCINKDYYIISARWEKISWTISKENITLALTQQWTLAKKT